MKRAIVLTLFSGLYAGSSAAAVGDQLPMTFIGWYAPAASATEHCTQPESWDDNYVISPRFVRFTDGQGDFATIKAPQPDTETLLVIYRVGAYEGDPRPRVMKQTEVWHLQAVGGETLLTRTITAIQSIPPSGEDGKNLPATLPTMRKC